MARWRAAATAQSRRLPVAGGCAVLELLQRRLDGCGIAGAPQFVQARNLRDSRTAASSMSRTGIGVPPAKRDRH